jgi:hypothetical protein
VFAASIMEQLLLLWGKRTAITSSPGVLAHWHTWMGRFSLAAVRQVRAKTDPTTLRAIRANAASLPPRAFRQATVRSISSTFMVLCFEPPSFG